MLSAKQYEFQKRTGIQSTVTDTMSKIAEEINTKNNPVGLFLDYQKAHCTTISLINWKNIV